jgi:hypothetical protein
MPKTVRYLNGGTKVNKTAYCIQKLHYMPTLSPLAKFFTVFDPYVEPLTPQEIKVHWYTL